MMVIQSLPQTIGLPTTRMDVLDALRRKRQLYGKEFKESWLAGRPWQEAKNNKSA